MAIVYFADDYNHTQKEVVVFEESHMQPAPKGKEGIWEYFDVHEPLNDVHRYGVDEHGLLYSFGNSGIYRCSNIACKIDGDWYNRETRYKNKP
ncbi:hypothetical protein [Serratia aquatilis]|uniref:Uncharacterized protein n=1 Tax=Serratia aquatilis TaxID=1737515 RepID=A0ABV6E9L9_9GAMM